MDSQHQNTIWCAPMRWITFAGYTRCPASTSPCSTRKRTDAAWSLQQTDAALLNGVLRVMQPGSTVFFSTNFRRFKFDLESIAPAQTIEISKQTVPEDYRNRRIHRCWKITVPEEPASPS